MVRAGFVLLGVLAGCSREGHASTTSTTSTLEPLPSASASASTSTSTSTTTTAPTETSTPPSGLDRRKGSLVVHIGDSFTYANFEQSLKPHFAAVGARYWVIAKNNTLTSTWLHEPKFEEYLYARPDLVLINLGANELEIPDPKPYGANVRELVAKTAKWAKACVWITPPTWKPETGYLEVVRDNCAPCVLFDSDALVPGVERQPDGMHPNKAGGAKWASTFWDWLEKSRDPSRGAWAVSPLSTPLADGHE